MSVVSATASVGRTISARRLLSVCGFGLLFDSMDVGLMAFVLVALSKAWHLNPSLSGLIGSIGFVGMALGSALAGLAADRFGRKSVFMWTLLIYSIATGLTAFATGVAVFILLRFLVGFGLGGELPVATTYVSESSDQAVRGRRVVLLEAFWAGGSLVAAIVSRLILPYTTWRIVFLVGALPALYLLVLRRNLPETPKFRNLTTVRGIGKSFRTLWQSDYVSQTLVTWVLWFVMNFAYYGMFYWLPSIMSMKGYSLVNSIGYVLIMTIAQVPGYLTSAWLVEKWGRKRTLLTMMILSALSALGFGFAHSTVWLIIFGLLLNYFMLGAFAGTYVFTVEQFPTVARASGIGWAAGFGRFGSVIAPFLVGALIAAGIGFSSIFGIFFAALVVGFLIVLCWGRETLGRPLE
ncbi:MAG: MFS transporter [Thermoflavifilum sp.]|nr:MFS transporter [Thermoflavifilum sp.]MCL6512863.1 MFS transporter [Alicyclobacillus sp.]